MHQEEKRSENKAKKHKKGQEKDPNGNMKPKSSRIDPESAPKSSTIRRVLLTFFKPKQPKTYKIAYRASQLDQNPKKLQI